LRVAVITFPGSNCDRDLAVAFERVAGAAVTRVWHQQTELEGFDLIGVPGGFSYGDYLRCGAIAAVSPVMAAVRQAAARGTAVLGVCNGFQILTEAGLLPGALIRNAALRFVCRPVALTVATRDSLFTRGYTEQATLRLPVAHHDGNYTIDEDGLKALQDQDRIAFRYVDNPNGSLAAIAGILNDKRNVLGLMPHPERAADALLGSEDGSPLFRALAGHFG